jgi:hypothetical protein
VVSEHAFLERPNSAVIGFLSPRFRRVFGTGESFRLIREKFTKERSAARTFARDYFERYPKDRYQTEVESWRHLQSGEHRIYDLTKPGREGGMMTFPHFRVCPCQVLNSEAKFLRLQTP